jgi:hypothetical protein
MNKNNIIYHYTSISAFESILKNKNIRLYNSNIMNDWTESKIFNYLMREQGLGDSLLFDFYIACFSKCGDKLSQWSRYGDDHDGVCIGFSFDDQIKKHKSIINTPGFNKLRKDYDDMELNNFITKYQANKLSLIIVLSTIYGDKLDKLLNNSNYSSFTTNFGEINPVIYTSNEKVIKLVEQYLREYQSIDSDNELFNDFIQLPVTRRLGGLLKSEYYSEEEEVRMIIPFINHFKDKNNNMIGHSNESVKYEQKCDNDGRLYIEKEIKIDTIKEVRFASISSMQKIKNIMSYYNINIDCLKQSKAVYIYRK